MPPSQPLVPKQDGRVILAHFVNYSHQTRPILTPKSLSLSYALYFLIFLKFHDYFKKQLYWSVTYDKQHMFNVYNLISFDIHLDS